MTSFLVNLGDVEQVKSFVAAAGQIACDVDVQADLYLVDGKSIMGIFSLDRTKPVTVQVHGDETVAQSLKSSIAHLLVS